MQKKRGRSLETLGPKRDGGGDSGERRKTGAGRLDRYLSSTSKHTGTADSVTGLQTVTGCPGKETRWRTLSLCYRPHISRSYVEVLERMISGVHKEELCASQSCSMIEQSPEKYKTLLTEVNRGPRHRMRMFLLGLLCWREGVGAGPAMPTCLSSF